MHVPAKNRHQRLTQHNLWLGQGVLPVSSRQRKPLENGGSLLASGFSR